MFKRLVAVVGLAVMAFGLLPAVVASAAPAASASIDKSTVFPGGDKTFTITVRNGESPLFAPTETIDYIRVTPPAVLLDEACPEVSGWSCVSHRGGFFDFTPVGGGLGLTGLAPGASLDIPFTGRIGAPNTADQTQAFVVDVSGDAGANGTFDRLPGLNVTVKVLQLVSGSIVEVKDGVVGDGVATRGQTITARFTARSFARNAISAVPTINGVARSAVSLAGIGATAVEGTTKDTNVSFTFSTPAGITPEQAVEALTINISAPGTSAGPLTGGFTVQGQPYLSVDLDSISDPVVRSSRKDSNGNHSGGVTYDLTLDAEKLNLPTVSGATARLELTGPGGPYAAAATISWDGTPWAKNSTATFAFAPITINADVPTGVLSGTLVLEGGTDNNGFAYSERIPLADLILIDNIAPIIERFDLYLPAGQLQGKAGDALDFDGEISDEQGNTVLPDDLTVTARIRNNITMATSDPIPVTVNGSGTAFSGTFVLPDTVPTNNGTATMPLPDFGLVTLEADLTDAAGNGSGAFADADIDNAVPLIKEAALVDGNAEDTVDPLGQTGGRYYVSVELTNDYNDADGTSVIAGGCTPSSWDVDETTVVAVFYSNGQSCQSGVAGPDNVRILGLLSTIDPNFPYQVTYDGSGLLADDLHDGANNLVEFLQDVTFTRIAPANPLFNQLQRYDTDADNGDYETVGPLGDPNNNDYVFHVNRGGQPGSQTPHITVGAASAAYDIVVTDELGNRLFTETAPTVDGDGFTTIDIPLPINTNGCDTGAGTGTRVGPNCELTRRITFFNPNAAPGSQFSAIPLNLTMVLDQTVPAIVASTLSSDASQVTVGYNESLAGGRNANQDWATVQRNPDAGQQQDEFLYRGVFDVQQGETANTRVLSGLSIDNRVPLYGVSYLFQGADALDVYEDLAGNRSATDVIFVS